jgi:hypothetical protein
MPRDPTTSASALNAKAVEVRLNEASDLIDTSSQLTRGPVLLIYSKDLLEKRLRRIAEREREQAAEDRVGQIAQGCLQLEERLPPNPKRPTPEQVLIKSALFAASLEEPEHHWPPTPERAAILSDYYDALINPKSQRQGRFNKLAGQVLDVDGARNQAEGVKSMFGLDRLLGFHLHRHESPWEDAPPWAIELRQMLRILLREEDYLMNVQSDIALALAKVSDDVAKQTTVVAGMKVYVQGLKDQIATLAAASTDTETAGALNALASQIEANTQSDADALVVNTPADPAVASEDKPAALLRNRLRWTLTRTHPRPDLPAPKNYP